MSNYVENTKHISFWEFLGKHLTNDDISDSSTEVTKENWNPRLLTS